MMRAYRIRWALAALTCTLLTSGCSGLRLEKLPHPAGVSGPTYDVTAEFADVSNLPMGAAVKINGAVVGVVEEITTKDYRAYVRMRLEKKFGIDAQSVFQVRFTTPLGEDYIAATPPAHATGTLLKDGAMVPLTQTNEAPGIEDTFAAVSLLLNGGGLDQIKTIAHELDVMFKGHTSAARDALDKLNAVVAHLDAHRADLDRALTSVASMVTSLNNGTALIEQALTTFPDVISLLSSQIGPVTSLAQKVAGLGAAVDDLLARSQSAILSDFDSLRPVLDSVGRNVDIIVPTMNALTTFGAALRSAAPGDYLNVDGAIQFLLDNNGEKPTLPPPTHATAASSAEQSTSFTASDGPTALMQLQSGGLS